MEQFELYAFLLPFVAEMGAFFLCAGPCKSHIPQKIAKSKWETVKYPSTLPRPVPCLGAARWAEEPRDRPTDAFFEEFQGIWTLDTWGEMKGRDV